MRAGQQRHDTQAVRLAPSRADISDFDFMATATGKDRMIS